MYLEDGQEVNLDNTLTDENGKIMYLVTPIYIGESFGCSGAGGSHHDWSVEYEHEGKQIVVDKIFEQPPTEKIDKKILDKEKELKQINSAIGILSLTITDLKTKESLLNKEINSKEFTLTQKEKLISQKTNEIEKQKNEIEKLTRCICEQNNKLKKLEDKVAFIAIKAASLNDESESKTMIDNKDLNYLKDRDYKLSLLEAGGVDNWEWYSESLKDYNNDDNEDE